MIHFDLVSGISLHKRYVKKFDMHELEVPQ